MRSYEVSGLGRNSRRGGTLKILHVIGSFNPPCSSGGAAVVAGSMTRALARRGHKVTVYTNNLLSANRVFELPVGPTSYEGIEIHYFKYSVAGPPSFFRFSSKFVRSLLANARSYDIVHLHEYRSVLGVVTSLACVMSGTPYIIQAHGQLPVYTGKAGTKLLFDRVFGLEMLARASQVIAISPLEATQYENVGVQPQKTSIIPNGVDLSSFRDLPPRGGFRSTYGIGESKAVILYLGRIHQIKGIDTLLNSYAMIRKANGPRESILVIAGPDYGYLKDATALAQSLGIADHVLFCGPLYGNDKLAAFVDADVVVVPSYYEIFGLVVLEAFACSRPVVASRVQTMDNLVRGSETGLLVEPGNAAELSKAISFVIENPEKGEAMGMRGRKLVEERYNTELVTDMVERLYENLLGDV